MVEGKLSDYPQCHWLQLFNIKKVVFYYKFHKWWHPSKSYYIIISWIINGIVWQTWTYFSNFVLVFTCVTYEAGTRAKLLKPCILALLGERMVVPGGNWLTFCIDTVGAGWIGARDVTEAPCTGTVVVVVAGRMTRCTLVAAGFGACHSISKTHMNGLRIS